MTSSATQPERGGAGRFYDYIASLADSRGNLMAVKYPGLASRPWHDAAIFPVSAALSDAFERIRSEVEALQDSLFQRENERIPRDGDWEVFPFYDLGLRHDANCARCPTIAGVLKSDDVARTSIGMSYLSRLGPGARIAPHSGPTNVRLRCHLGIGIPRGDCAISVGGVVKRWSSGTCIVFDDSLEHSAWNLAQTARLVLVVDVWHPDLTPSEVSLLQGFHAYALEHAKILPGLWNRNRRARATFTGVL